MFRARSQGLGSDEGRRCISELCRSRESLPECVAAIVYQVNVRRLERPQFFIAKVEVGERRIAAVDDDSECGLSS